MDSTIQATKQMSKRALCSYTLCHPLATPFILSVSQNPPPLTPHNTLSLFLKTIMIAGRDRKKREREAGRERERERERREEAKRKANE